jgi:hypothetical protein
LAKIFDTDIDFDSVSRGVNCLDPVNPQDVSTKKYTDGSSASTSAATYTVGSETFLRGFGTTAIAVTIPSTRAREITIKNVSTQDMTITFQGGQIDGQATLVLRGGRRQSATFAFEGGDAWII